jgi:hypothetical protein
MEASLEKIAHLIKVCGFLLQTKVYLFWRNMRDNYARARDIVCDSMCGCGIVSRDCYITSKARFIFIRTGVDARCNTLLNKQRAMKITFV